MAGKESADASACPAAAASRSSTTAPEAAGAAGTQKPKRYVTLLPSVFEGRPPVIFFQYTEACGAKQRSLDRAVPADADGPRIFYSHTDAVHEYNAVVNILRQGGLYRVRPDTQRWLLLWSKHPPPETLRVLKPVQKTNHFRGSWHLGRKDLIWKSISKMQRRFGKAYQITPQAFVLPKAFVSWEAARTRQPHGLWIWKPCSSSCGRGIKVFSSLNMGPDEVKELGRKRGVIQRYVPNPLLIFGYKFDLRIYVVILSYDPLKVYINDEGLVRLATEKYSASPDTLEKQTMHLTNYSVNKASPAFVQNRDGRDGAEAVANTECDDDEGPGASKWSLGELRAHFKRQGLDYGAMFDRIKDLVIKTLIAVEGPIQVEWTRAFDASEEEGWSARGAGGAHRASCFEMYGFDVLVDADMKPWLLEVNICPSLSSGSPLDKRIKTKLVADTLTLVGLRPPRGLWRKARAGFKRTAADVPVVDEKDLSAGAGPCAGLCNAALQARAAKLAGCSTPQEALALFDDAAWEMVLDAHDEDMRSGGLERIHPAADSAKYAPYFSEESYCNLVLRKFYEAGGGDLFKSNVGRKQLPAWVPRQVCFSST